MSMKIKTIINAIKKGNKIKAAGYINENAILLEAGQGKNINGNMFALLKNIEYDKQWSKYIPYFVVTDSTVDAAKERCQFYNFKKVQFVIRDTQEYWKLLTSCKYVMTDNSFPTLYTKQPGQVYLNTWHGTPIKKMGADVGCNNKSFKGKGHWKLDYFTCQGEFEQEIFCRVFNSLSKDKAHVIGLPRNDIYANYNKEYMITLRKKMGIAIDKRVILYAPTFREYDKSSSMEVKVSVPIQIEKWRKELGEDYVLLFRAHYEVAKGLNIKDDDFVREMSSYPQLEDLMIVSDLLISDYSSIFFDYSIMSKPMLAFCYDYERYNAERGMYFDIREWLPNAENEDDLLMLIKSGMIEKQVLMTRRFQQKFVTAYGFATKQSLDVLFNELNKTHD